MRGASREKLQNALKEAQQRLGNMKYDFCPSCLSKFILLSSPIPRPPKIKKKKEKRKNEIKKSTCY